LSPLPPSPTTTYDVYIAAAAQWKCWVLESFLDRGNGSPSAANVVVVAVAVLLLLLVKGKG